MKNSKNIFAFICISILFTFCKKDKRIDNPLFVNYEVNNAVCYPKDSTSLQFSLVISGGTAPYEIKWVEPINYNGSGPFTINLTSDKTFSLNVKDADGLSKDVAFTIKKELFDSLEYDYRNTLTGDYACEKVYSYLNISSGTITVNPPQTATITVKKNANFTAFDISSSGGFQIYNIYNHIFQGYHGYGYFKDDSIFITEQLGLGAAWQNYRGKKQ